MKDLSEDEIRDIIRRENEELQPFINKYDNHFMHIHNFTDKHFYMFSVGDEIVVSSIFITITFLPSPAVAAFLVASANFF